MSPASRTESRLHPKLTRLPMGSSFGKNCRAAASVMRITFGLPARSASVNPLPRTTGIPMAGKYPAVAIRISAAG